MRNRNLLLTICVAMAWSGLAAAQTPASPGVKAPVRQPAVSPTPSAATPESRSMPQQTVAPAQPNAARTASRGVGTSVNRPDCSQMRGIEKSECERRDTVRDDLPAGVTTTQHPQPPR